MPTITPLSPQKRAFRMQVVDMAVAVTDLGHEGARITLQHLSTRLERGLELGERVVLVDASSRRRGATVMAVDFELTDTVYTLELAAMPASTGRVESVQSVVDLLAELRERRDPDA